MALASTPDLASYGFGYWWAQQAYVPGPSQGYYGGASYEPSSITTGNKCNQTHAKPAELATRVVAREWDVCRYDGPEVVRRNRNISHRDSKHHEP